MSVKTIENNHLYWDSCDTVALALKIRHPLYVLSENAILQRTQVAPRLSRQMTTCGWLSASKAFNTVAMCQLIAREGA